MTMTSEDIGQIEEAWAAQFEQLKHRYDVLTENNQRLWKKLEEAEKDIESLEEKLLQVSNGFRKIDAVTRVYGIQGR